MSDEREEIILRTYTTVWKIDRKIYSLEGVKLWFPVSPNEALYFSISVGVSILLTKIVPFYNNLHFIIKFVMVPFGLMKFFTKQKLDGKLPHKFFIDYLLFKISPKKYVHFAPVEELKKIRIVTPIVYRQMKITDVTENIINRKKRWGK